MVHHILSWGQAGLVTVDLDDERRVVLVFVDPDQAGRAGQAVATQAGQPVEVVEIDADADGISGALEVLLGISGAEVELLAVFPGDRLFEQLAAELGIG